MKMVTISWMRFRDSLKTRKEKMTETATNEERIGVITLAFPFDKAVYRRAEAIKSKKPKSKAGRITLAKVIGVFSKRVNGKRKIPPSNCDQKRRAMGLFFLDRSLTKKSEVPNPIEPSSPRIFGEIMRQVDK